MDIIAPQSETDNYRAWLEIIGEAGRRALFGVTRGATHFRCQTNGRSYDDEAPREISGYIWASCGWCDVYGRMKGQPGYNPDAPQPHCYPVENDDEATQAFPR